jgi:hypothetical protein
MKRGDPGRKHNSPLIALTKWLRLLLSLVGKEAGMAKLVFGMDQSLDGYVDQMAFAPSPTLFRPFIEAAQGQAGSVYGRHLAQSLTALGLIDEYRIYLHPVVLGQGKPYFAGPRPPLRLMTNDRIGEDVIRLTYVPASLATRPCNTDR